MSTTGNGTIGDRIKECRKDLGMSQEALAEILYMKKSTISKYESNDRDIPASTIVSLSEARRRQTIRLTLKYTPLVMSGVVSCILPEDFLTMALSNPALQDLYFLFRHSVLATL